MEWNMEEIFCMEWNMEEIFRYGMEDGIEKNCRYGIWKNRLPFHSITCPASYFIQGQILTKSIIQFTADNYH